MGPEQYYGYDAPVYGPSGPDTGKRKRIIIGVVGLSVFLFLVIAVLLMLFSKPSVSKDVFKLAAMHNEVARVSEFGISSDRARRSTQNLAANAHSVSINNLRLITNYVDENFSTKLTKLELKAEENLAIDQLLIEAGLSNEYDSEFARVVSELMTQTNNEIIKVFENASDQELKDILNEIGTNNQTIIESAKPLIED